MIVYNETKGLFVQDVKTNVIATKILSSIREKGLNAGQEREFAAWQNSMQFMRNIVDDSDIDDDVQIAIEYNIPQTSKRVDFIISGANEKGEANIVIVELKQWTKAEVVDDDMHFCVRTFVANDNRIVCHPSYQAYSYKRSIENYCSEVNNDNIELLPCAYCHNLGEEYRSDIEDEIYEEWINEAPLFLQRDVLKLRAFIKQYITAAAKDGQLLYKIDHGKIKPQKALQDALYSMLKGNEEFMLLDDQIVAYDRCNQIIEMSLADHRKRTIIIQGGPGTGKSVLAINLLVNTVRNYKEFCVYVTKNAAPKTCYQKILAAKDTRREIDI